MNYSISNILVAVDISETSLNALETSIALAKRHGASITVLNVIEPKFSQSESAVLFGKSILSNSEDVLQALLGSVQHTHEITPRLIQRKGSVAEAVIRTSIEEQADLIVIGTHGAAGYRDG